MGIILTIINILILIFIVRAVLSFVDQYGRWQITRVLDMITEPILTPIRRVVPSMGGLDFSSTIVIIILVLIRGVL